jgi:hypothetical protein
LLLLLVALSGLLAMHGFSDHGRAGHAAMGEMRAGTETGMVSMTTAADSAVRHGG